MNSNFGIYEYITADYVMAGAKMRLGIKDTTEDDLLLLDIVNEGSKRLRNLGSFVPMITTLPINDLKAKLPEGFVQFNHAYPIVYVDQNGSALLNTFANVPQFINNTFFTDSPFTANQFQFRCGGTVNIVNGYLYFSNDVTAEFCKIAYLSTNLTDDGEVAIPAIAEDAIRNFACWQYALAFSDKFTQYQAISWERAWKNGKKQLKGIYNQSQGTEWPFIAYKMKSMI